MPSTPQMAFEPLNTGMPDEHKHTFTVNPFAVRELDQRFFNSLILICENTDDRHAFTKSAKGSGRQLVLKMFEESTRADAGDRALCSTRFNNLVHAGLPGEFTWSNFGPW